MVLSDDVLKCANRQVVLEYKKEGSSRPTSKVCLTTDDPKIILDIKSNEKIDINQLMIESKEVYVIPIH